MLKIFLKIFSNFLKEYFEFLGEFNDDDDDMVKKPLEYPTDDPDKELSDSRRATLRSPAKFGSFFRNGGKKALL